ncbi:MAG: 16S rRNA (cytidine(1402)-2'-O)-methyltransferase [Atopobiaceae bacterium]|nr:16S rRNA (cytidine(1402)-2'-O)-methyltransferase [Atopobiaceae bacterium]
MSETTFGMLSLVGTPIGNLDDASVRMVETLRRADVVLCEDTRVTSKLLSRFDIHVPLVRCDQNVLLVRLGEALARVDRGERVAFVSDAGMPGISDPGQKLVDAALDRGLPLEIIPGPSAVTCALVASGLPIDHFFFEGFLPRKPGARERRLRELAAVPGALVFYESPRRVVATLESLASVFPLRRAALVRELTKVHEEVVRELTPALCEQIRGRSEVRGECVIVVEGPVAAERTDAASDLDEQIRIGLQAGESKSRLARRLAKACGLSRSDVYDQIMQVEVTVTVAERD